MMGFMTAISVAQVLGTWPMWGGEPTHKSVQLMRGAITTPTIKWRFATGDAVEWQFSAIADVDADGQMEVVIGSLDNKVYCLRGSDGTQKWVFTTGGDVYSSPALADVDGDGEMEVVIGSWDRNVYCLRGSDGTQKWVFTTG
ncbi:MAG: FG-GAP-like repeat-containing protein, partial [candidate division WOR-3 bacterium]